jgi:hypothetical protein
MILDKQTANAQREEAVRKLGIVGSELDGLKSECRKIGIHCYTCRKTSTTGKLAGTGYSIWKRIA